MDEFSSLGGGLAGNPGKRLAHVIKVFGPGKYGPEVVTWTAVAVILSLSPEGTPDDDVYIEGFRDILKNVRGNVANPEYLYKVITRTLNSTPRYNVDYPFAVLIPWYAKEVNRLLKQRAKTKTQEQKDAIGHLMQWPLYVNKLPQGLLATNLTKTGLWAQATKHDILKTRLTGDLVIEIEEWAPELDVAQGDVVYEFDDGWTVQELRTREQIEDEGGVMQNCLDQCDTYHWDEKVEQGESRIFSLRDPKGEPHVSMELNVATSAFDQVFGKQNNPPIPEYQARVDEFAEEQDFTASLCAYYEDQFTVEGDWIILWDEQITDYAELAFISWIEREGVLDVEGSIAPNEKVQVRVDCTEEIGPETRDLIDNWNDISIDHYSEDLSEAGYTWAQWAWSEDGGWEGMRSDQWWTLQQALPAPFGAWLKDAASGADNNLPDEDTMGLWLMIMRAGDALHVEDGAYSVWGYNIKHEIVAAYLSIVLRGLQGARSHLSYEEVTQLFDAFEELFRKADIDVERGIGFAPDATQTHFEFDHGPIAILGFKADMSDLFQYGEDLPELALFYIVADSEFTFIQEDVDGASFREIDEVTSKLAAKYDFTWAED